jgi:hypothetical protein
VQGEVGRELLAAAKALRAELITDPDDGVWCDRGGPALDAVRRLDAAIEACERQVSPALFTADYLCPETGQVRSYRHRYEADEPVTRCDAIFPDPGRDPAAGKEVWRRYYLRLTPYGGSE